VFGADAGLLAVLLAFINNLNNEGVIDLRDAISAFLETVGGSPKICYHTDSTTNGKDGRGCTHCRLVQDMYEKYGLTSELAGLFKETLIEAKARPYVLTGEHAPSISLILRQTGEIKEDGSGALILDHRIFDKGEKIQMLVCRPDLAMLQIVKLARNLLRYSALGSSGISEQGVVHQLWKIQQQHRKVTDIAMAAHVPHVRAIVNKYGVCEKVCILPL